MLIEINYVIANGSREMYYYYKLSTDIQIFTYRYLCISINISFSLLREKARGWPWQKHENCITGVTPTIPRLLKSRNDYNWAKSSEICCKIHRWFLYLTFTLRLMKTLLWQTHLHVLGSGGLPHPSSWSWSWRSTPRQFLPSSSSCLLASSSMVVVVTLVNLKIDYQCGEVIQSFFKWLEYMFYVYCFIPCGIPPLWGKIAKN